MVVKNYLRRFGFFSPEKAAIANMLRDYLITTTPIYIRRIEQDLDTIHVLPVKPKANPKEVDVAWT